MANPVFSRDPVFSAKGARGTPARLAGPLSDAGPMTYDDVIIRTAGLLVLLVTSAAVAWAVAPELALLCGVVALVLGLVNAFKRTPSPALIIAYTLFQGAALGGLSYAFQNMPVEGSSTGTATPIVLQATLATAVTFGVTLALFKSGKVRVTAKFTKWLLISMIGYLAFSVLNVVLSFVMPSDGFGPLRNGWIGLAVGLVAVGLAAASLLVDFDSIERGVRAGAPRDMAWQAAFGLIVTLVWLYAEFLRIFAMLTRR